MISDAMSLPSSTMSAAAEFLFISESICCFSTRIDPSISPRTGHFSAAMGTASNFPCALLDWRYI